MIDDDDISLKIVTLTVKRYHFAECISILKNGKEGIGYLDEVLLKEKVPPTLIFLDINMPVMDGWEFLEEYTQRFEKYFPQTSICMLTSSLDPQDQERASHYPSVIAFLSKPFVLDNMAMLRSHPKLRYYFK
ncbi:response regulator [Telluribacter humicola]